jgi:hypothetical protein
MRKFLKMYRLPRLLWAFVLMAGLSFPLFVQAGTMPASDNVADEKEGLYEQLQLKALGLSHQAFSLALKGFQQLVRAGKIQKDNLLSILDFSLPSGKKRLFVIDLATGQLMFHTYAAHGKKSGMAIPTRFSNKVNSNKSSLGFYLTGETYNGSHGESLRLLGEEKGINDKALQRGIVIHSASYVDEATVQQQGFIGRSQGCPAIPKDVYHDVIETIKDGSCIFMYSPDKFYLSHSKILRGKP